MAVKDISKAVIPAAGLGTRFLPATKATPKEMLPVVDKPAIQYVVEEAVSAHLSDVLMITGRNKRPLEDHFDRNYELEEALSRKGDESRLRGRAVLVRRDRPLCPGSGYLRGAQEDPARPRWRDPDHRRAVRAVPPGGQRRPRARCGVHRPPLRHRRPWGLPACDCPTG